MRCDLRSNVSIQGGWMSADAKKTRAVEDNITRSVFMLSSAALVNLANGYQPSVITGHFHLI